MKARVLGALITVSLASGFLPGCSRNETDKSHARLNLEEQAQRDAERGNKAITDLNKRMFGKKAVVPAITDSPKVDDTLPPPASPAKTPKY